VLLDVCEGGLAEACFGCRPRWRGNSWKTVQKGREVGHYGVLFLLLWSEFCVSEVMESSLGRLCMARDGLPLATPDSWKCKMVLLITTARKSMGVSSKTYNSMFASAIASSSFTFTLLSLVHPTWPNMNLPKYSTASKVSSPVGTMLSLGSKNP
jgi:hypothetical protein